MNQITLATAYKAMLYVARMEEVELDQKYYNLEDEIDLDVELSVTDMVDNLDHFYNAIKGGK
jgi:hypothetical protein